MSNLRPLDHAEQIARKALNGFDAATITHIQRSPKIQGDDSHKIRAAKIAWRRYHKLFCKEQDRQTNILGFVPYNEALL